MKLTKMHGSANLVSSVPSHATNLQNNASNSQIDVVSQVSAGGTRSKVPTFNMLQPRDLYLRMRRELIKQSEEYMKTIVEYDEDENE